MRKLLFVAVAIVGIVVSAGVYAAATAIGSSHGSRTAPASLARVSVAGVPIQLPAGRGRDSLERSGYGPVALVGTRGNQAFFQIKRSSGDACYGSGSVGAAWPIGRFVCQNGLIHFPSAEQPILDFSLVVGSVGESGLHFEQVAGVAADGVAAVNAVDLQGNTVLRIPVRDNFYSSGTTNLGVSVVRIQAVDAAGNVLATSPS